MAVSQEEVLDTISSMTVMEIVDLISAMEEKFGVSAAAAVAAVPAGAVAGDAGEARTARDDKKFDLVLLDIWMPGTDGITLLREWPEPGSGSGSREPNLSFMRSCAS